MNLKNFENKLHTLAVFHSFYQSPLWVKLSAYFQSQTEEELLQSYTDLCAYIYSQGGDLSKIVERFVLDDENYYQLLLHKESGKEDLIERSMIRELEILQQLHDLKGEMLFKDLPYPYELPSWSNHVADLKHMYQQRLENLNREGYGIFARYHMFQVNENGLVPIQYPDPQSLASMTGYEIQRNALIQNTLAFLKGMKANNALLYGDAGTGKSSTIKAIVNAYKDEGLRLIEVRKSQIQCLPSLIESLAENPLKFIIFIDDLSFQTGDPDFILMKTILEGGSVASLSNTIIYATSNRRHLMKESFDDRAGSDIHHNDTIQECASLASRFGLTITFSKPAKDLYFEIVKGYAKEYDLQLSDSELMIKAEAFALRNNGRSPRTARQFVEHQKIVESMK